MNDNPAKSQGFLFLAARRERSDLRMTSAFTVVNFDQAGCL